MTAAERTVDVGGTALFLREWGAEPAPPILFWHALGDHTGLQMLEAGPILADEFGYRVVALDAPGFGGSERVDDSGYAVASLVELAARLLDGLGLHRFAWAGSSWGASLGVHFTVTHPERTAALALIDGGYMDPTVGEGMTLEELREHWRSQPLWRFESWEALDDDARQYFRRWTAEVQEICRSAYRELDGQVVSIMGPDVYAAAIHGIQQGSPVQALPALGRTDVPVLLLGSTLPGDREQALAEGRARFEQLVPQANVRAIPDAPHFLLEDQPAETARAVGEWLRALPYA